MRGWMTTRSRGSSMTRLARKPRVKSPAWEQRLEPLRHPLEIPFRRRADALAGNARPRAIAALYSELDEVARAVPPGTVLALSTPVLHGGAAGTEARRVDLAGLAPSQAWRSVGLDLQAWPTGPNVPIVLRGVEVLTDPL